MLLLCCTNFIFSSLRPFTRVLCERKSRAREQKMKSYHKFSLPSSTFKIYTQLFRDSTRKAFESFNKVHSCSFLSRELVVMSSSSSHHPLFTLSSLHIILQPVSSPFLIFFMTLLLHTTTSFFIVSGISREQQQWGKWKSQRESERMRERVRESREQTHAIVVG